MTKYRAIIIGATSGIGHEVAHSLAQRGVILGIAGRRTERLDAFVEEYGAERIYSESFSGGELGQAIMNRLMKAAGHRVVRTDEGETLHFK